MKYFLFSDTHGINPNIIKEALSKKGFDNNNSKHVPVLAGDICDGLLEDNKLIDYLRTLNNLIVVKGNHDIGDKNILWWHNTTFKENLTKENFEFMNNLEYQIDVGPFYLAHGMYIDIESKFQEQASVWASPILFGAPNDMWVHIDGKMVKMIKEKYNDSIVEYEKSLDKPLFIGHFDQDGIDKYLDTVNVDVMKNSQGFLEYGKIVWLDKRVVNDESNFDVYIWEDK